MSYWEIIAAIFGVLCVAFYIARSMWAWPTGLIQVILYIVIFWQAKLYADMLLQVIYVGLQVYGWWEWASTPTHQPQPAVALNQSVVDQSTTSSSTVSVRRLSVLGLIGGLVGTIALTIVITWLLRNYTDGQSPEADAFVTAVSLAAQILLAMRFFENWLLWILVDTVAVGLFWHRQLYPTAILYGVFWFMAWAGLFSWLHAFRNQHSEKGVT